jgi:hypothetical protein
MRLLEAVSDVSDLESFFTARLTSKEAETEWRANLIGIYDALLATKIGELVDATTLADALDALLTSSLMRTGARPIARRIVPIVLGELIAQGRLAFGDHVPPTARARLDRVLERPKLIPESLVREVMEQDAMEAVMRDVLYDALHEFMEKTSPIALFKKLIPFGGLGLGKGFDTAKAEFDKRLDPEIRRFLTAFSRRALKKSADIMIAKADTPEFVTLRKKLLAWALDQEIAATTKGVDAGLIEEGQDIALEIAEHVLEETRVRERRRARVAELVRDNAGRTLGEALALAGVTHRPDLDALARATWPLAKTIFTSRPVRGWFTKIAGEVAAR